MEEKELMVAAIENGTVIDHIPNAKLFEVVRLLRLDEVGSSSTIMVGFNLKSRKMGHKSIIKISNRIFTDAELNKLAVVTPNVTLSIIKNFHVTEKKQVELPGELVGVVKCGNPMCISNNEPMKTRFHVVEGGGRKIRCDYCEKEQDLDHVKLL